MNNTMTATYSLEDNKLRIYTEEWLDDETYKKVKDCGFIWAPKQKLFVAPKWTPARENLCIALAGSIAAEETTLLERAEAKIERLDEKQVGHYAYGELKTGAAVPYFRDQSLYQQLEEKIITADQCVEICLDFHYDLGFTKS